MITFSWKPPETPESPSNGKSVQVRLSALKISAHLPTDRYKYASSKSVLNCRKEWHVLEVT